MAYKHTKHIRKGYVHKRIAYLTADTGADAHTCHDSNGRTFLPQLVSDSDYKLSPSKHVTCLQDPKYVTFMQDAMLDHACIAQPCMC